MRIDMVARALRFCACGAALAVALGALFAAHDHALADHGGPHDDDVVVVGTPTSCPDGATCSDQVPEFLSIGCCES